MRETKRASTKVPSLKSGPVLTTNKHILNSRSKGSGAFCRFIVYLIVVIVIFLAGIYARNSKSTVIEDFSSIGDCDFLSIISLVFFRYFHDLLFLLQMLLT
jgi:hypothetical protein